MSSHISRWMMFPARAGMNRTAGTRFTVARDVPRTRGDEPRTCAYCWGCSRMFPARAGMNRACYDIRTLDSNVPRTRGDEPPLDLMLAIVSACSPHARG